ncbi:MAG: filamentous hemagglutinin N-terminal domain-containing protein, partial [Parachlamydiales bacterium]
KITASDKTIINYQSFNINESEHVEFIQPSDKATILNRVTGKDPSKILGKLSGNGRVFLVNPSGIYFGPNATVNTGSFLASTLNILDDDFLNDRFKFFQEIGSEKSSIVNEGNISVSPEGFIALFAPIIQNKGSILAHAGKVVLASSEKVAIDFSGDGLIQFTAEGDLEKALIENYGNIEAANGAVELTLRAAKKAIKMVVNADGIKPADEMTEVNGVIHLVNSSSIIAKKVEINGKDNSNIIVEGSIDASNLNIGEKGGTVHVLGDYVSLKKAEINASGDIGGGEVLIGGGYQGKEEVHNAISTVVDADTNIYCDAIQRGDGGKVIVWSDDTTYYNGQIYARGGKEIGDGGFVETSGKENLGVAFGNANTMSPNGKIGSWLLDPSSITIVRNNTNQGSSALANAADCFSGGSFTINDTTINNAASLVVLCAGTGTITQNNDAVINMIQSGVDLRIAGGNFTFQTGANTTWQITTNFGFVDFNSVVTIPNGVTLNVSTGTDVTFLKNVLSAGGGAGTGSLSVSGGTGTTTFSGQVSVNNLLVVSATIDQQSIVYSFVAGGTVTYGSLLSKIHNITTSGGTVSIGPVLLYPSITINTTAGSHPAGADIILSDTLDGATTLTFNAGTGGNVSFGGNVGASTTLTNLIFTDAARINIGANIKVTGANPLIFSKPVSITGPSTINSGNGNVSFSSTIDGAQSLIITGGSGTTTFTGAVGGSTALTSLSATAATITQSSTVKTTGAVSYTGATALNVNGNITTSGGSITMTGPVTISGTPTFDSTNGGATPAGANISFSSTLNGAVPLILRAGTGGAISFGGAVGGTNALTSLSATAASITQSSTARTVGAISYTAPSAININGDITTTGMNGFIWLTGATVISNPTIFTTANSQIDLDGSLDGATSLTFIAGIGPINLPDNIGGITPLTNLIFTSTSNILVGNITVTGANPLVFPFPTLVSIPSNTINSNNADVTFNSTLDGNSNRSLTVNGGSGTTTLAASSSQLKNLSVTAATINQSSTVATTGTLSYTGSTAINVNGNITTNGGSITMTGPVAITGSPTFDSTNAGVAPAGANIGFSSTLNGAVVLTLNAGSAGIVSLSGAVGGTTPLTSLTVTAATITQSSSAKTTGALTYTGTTAININGSITTSGSVITMTGPVAITGTSIFDTTNSGAVPTGANIDFATSASTINGANSLTLRAGTGGVISFGGSIGGSTPLTKLSFTSASLINIGSNITVTADNPLTFPSPVSLTGTSNITSNGADISFNSTLNGAHSLTLTAGSGTVLFTGAIGTTALTSLSATAKNIIQFSTVKTTGSLSYTGSTIITINNSITTSGGIITMTGPVVLSAACIFDTTNSGPSPVPAGANINFVSGASTINGATSLTLKAGTGGIISLSGAVGGSVPLTNLSFASANLIQIGSNITITGANPLAFPSPVNMIGTSIINSNNADVSFSSTLNEANALTISAGSGIITFTGSIGAISPLTSLSTTAATVTQTSSAKTTGALSYSGSSAINVNGNITTNGGSITMTGPVLITGAPVFDSTNGGTTPAGANINFATLASTINGNTSLTLNAGTGGTISLSGAIGGTTPLTSLTATAANITQSSSAKTTGALSYTGSTAININGSITTSGGIITMTGPVAITGALNFDATNSGAVSTGADINFATSASTINGANSLTLGAGTVGIISLSGAVGGSVPLTKLSFASASLIKIGSNITVTVDNSLIFPSPVSLTGTSNITSNDANILFNSTLNGANSLTFTAGTGIVTFADIIGGTAPLTNLFFVSASLIEIANNITVTGANPLIFSDPVSLTGSSSINSNNADITFGSTVDGTFDLTLASGSGSISFVGAAGGTSPLVLLKVLTANNLTANDITASSIIQTAGTGTTTFNGPIITSASAGINLTGNAFTFNNTVNTADNGSLLINNNGLLTMESLATCVLSGPFSQIGLGVSKIGNSISSDDQISFTTAVSLIGNASIDTSSTSHEINFMSTIDNYSSGGPFDLTLKSGASNILISGNIGFNFPIAAFKITSAQNVSLQSLVSNSAILTTGSGDVTVNGTIDVGSGGIDISGNNFYSSGNITTTALGDITIINTGNITGATGIIITCDGDFSQSGTGLFYVSGTTIVHGNLSVGSRVIVFSPSVIDLSVGGGSMIFSNTIDGGYGLSLLSSGGSILLSGAVGSITPIGALNVSSSGDLTTQGIKAASITQTSSSGTTTFNGALITSGVAGISINTNSVVRKAAITTTGAGPLSVTISNAGTLTSTAAGDINLTGAFTQNGLGAVSLAGNINTTNANISFSGPITLTGNTSLNTGTGAGNINLSQTIDGTFNLSLDSGTGNITLSADAGTGLGTALNSFSITHAATVSTQAITAASIAQSAGSVSTTFNGALNTSGAAGISLTGTAFTFNAAFTTAAAGPLSVTNTGLLTFAAGATGSVAGALTQNGSGGTLLSSAITAGGAMQFNGPFAVLGTGLLNTSAANANISFLNTLNGTIALTDNLTLSSGTGDILFSQNAGSLISLGTLTISTAKNFTAQAVTASSLTQSAGSGTTLFNGSISTSGAIGIDLNGTTFTILQNMITTGGGPVSITNSGVLTTTAGKSITSNGIFTQDGSGSVLLGCAITTTNASALSAAINFSGTSPITLTAPVVIDSSIGGGTISFSAASTVKGNQPITLIAGSGDISILGSFGDIASRLGAFTITSVKDATIQAVTAGSITQTNGTGTSTLNGSIDTDTPVGITLTGNNFTVDVGAIAITTTNGGSFTVTNSGLVSGAGATPITIDGSFIQNGTGPIVIGGPLTANQGISFTGPVIVGANAHLDTTVGSGNIVFSNTVNGLAGTETLTLDANAGNVTFSGIVGGTKPVILFIQSLNNITASSSLTIGSISNGTALTGQATFNGLITTSGGITLTGNNFTFNNVTTNNNGVMSITNSGTLTISGGSVLTVDGGFTQNGAGPVSFGGSITTSNDNISFLSDITLIAAAALNSGSGLGDITLNGAVDGAENLIVTAGNGNVDFQNSIGDLIPLTNVAIQSAAGVTLNSNVAVSVAFVTGNITPISGTTSFNGTLNAASIELNGSDINFNDAVFSGNITITNAGTLTVASSSPISSYTTFIQSGAGSVSLGSDISSIGNLSIDSPITLTNDIVLNSDGGDLILLSAVDGNFDLTLTAGAGNVILSGPIGSTNRISAFTITSANNVVVSAITASSIILQNAAGTTDINDNLDTNSLAGITFIGNNFNLFGLTINTTNAGPLIITNSGSATWNVATTITLDGGFTQNGTGSNDVGGTLTTSGGDISYSGAVNALLASTYTSNGGNITFFNTVDGPECIELIAGAGDVTFSSTVGGITPLGCLKVTSANNVFQNAAVTATGSVDETATTVHLGGDITTSATNITLNSNIICSTSTVLSTGVGTAGNIQITGTFNGTVAGHDLTMDAGSGNIILDSPIGAMISYNNVTLNATNITWAGLGSSSFGATGTTSLTATTDITFTGTVYNNGTQNYTAGGIFDFTSLSPASVTSNALPITFTTGTITPATINLSNSDLTLISNGGTITMGNLSGPGFNFTVNAGMGIYNFNQIGSSGQDLNNVDLTANTFNPTPVLNTNVFAVSLQQNAPDSSILSGHQPSSIMTYNVPVFINGAVDFSCPGPGMVIFNSTVDALNGGVNSLSFDFNPCGGSIEFNGPVGSTAPFDFITVDSATDLTMASSVNIGYLTVTNGVGTTSINSGITTTDVNGISIQTANINLSGSIVIQNGGPLTLVNTGALVIAAGSSLSISGAFDQSGGGNVNIGGSLSTQDALIQFADPITLNSNLSINSNGSASGDIAFGSTIQGTTAGGQNLTLASGSRDITFSGTVGNTTRIGALRITSARDVAADAISATSITQVAGSGTTTFNGALNASIVNGINLTGSAFAFNNNVTTAAAGPLTINNSALLSFSNSTYSISGALTQTGAGLVNLSGAFTSGGLISFLSGVTLTGASNLNTSSNNQNILFSSTLTNDNIVTPHALTLNSGTGNITFSGAIGSTPIGALNFTNARNITAGAISAASITQSAGTGTTAISGNMTTTGVSGISFTGTNFNINSTLITTGSGPFSIVNSGPLSLILGSSTSIAGAFSQSGGGAVSLSGKVATVNQNISFANAITLTGSTTLSTDTGAGTITLSSTVNGNQNLILTAGTGNIIFGPSLGATVPIGAITVNSVQDITYPLLVKASSIGQLGSSGTTIITGPINTTGALGISITGGTITQNGSITTANSGPVTFTNNTPGILTIGANINSAGAFTQNG